METDSNSLSICFRALTAVKWPLCRGEEGHARKVVTRYRKAPNDTDAAETVVVLFLASEEAQ